MLFPYKVNSVLLPVISFSITMYNLAPSNGVVMPLAYLPSVDQYCHLVNKANTLFEVYETYPKQTCRNRTIIYTANGLLRLTVPVLKPHGNHTMTCDVLLDNHSRWNHIHWKAIASAYGNSPYFLYYKDELEMLYEKPEGLLVDFNLKLIHLINHQLRINPAFELTTRYVKTYEGMQDKRNCPKDLLHTHLTLAPYTQVFSDRMPFIANLSILDLLFNEGPHAVSYMKAIQL